jgi:hypothetical protein
MPASASPAAPASKPNGATEWIMPVAAVALIFVMLVPLPSLVLDVLLAFSITAAVLVLLSAIQILRPSQFSVFPSLLLLLTLFRLSLNLASSRRILLHGNEGVSAAGHVIEAFGSFVVGGNYVVGFVIFIALIAIQYGVGSANLLYLPIAGKMKLRIREEQIIREMTLEGVASILEGMNPRMLETKLLGFLVEAGKPGTKSSEESDS